PMPLRSFACLLLACAASFAHAQAWPSRPIKMIVPFPAGGPTDVMTRILSDKLGQALGQPVVVENRPGAGGSIGADLVAKSAPDGYTLLMATGSTHSVGPYLQKLPYDPGRDFTPIVYVGYATNILLVSPKLGVNNVRELIEYAKKEPGRLTYATSGIGSVAHLTSEMFAAMAGAKLTHVPYKGTQLSINDMISGQVGILFDNVMTAKPHVDSGRLKGIAISSLARSSIVPDIPTVAESGLPGFDSTNWFGVFGPAGMPRAVTDRIDIELNRILADPAIKERFHGLGFEITGGRGADLASVMQSEARKWSKVIQDANVKAE
ncbi:MAG TPA: tripartite tricarboxylate transporter substrate binding protein, partial [Usitatibacter sp.]|nr:tripartite tricarboxylate transporter substrate binding protein [Usitatibacter sp.]